jgi:hypothetical protein
VFKGGKSHDHLCVDNFEARLSGYQQLTDLDELRNYLRILDLTDVAPPEFITVDAQVRDHGTYTHNGGSKDEWSLTWTKVDGDTP